MAPQLTRFGDPVEQSQNQRLTRFGDPVEESPKNPIVDFAQQFGGGVLDTLESMGGPSYAVEKTEEGFRPAQSGVFREQVGLPSQSDTLAGRMGQISGEAASLAIPFGGAATRIKKAPETAGRAARMLTNMLSGYGAKFRAAPARAISSEALSGATAGGGGFIANEFFPDSDAAQFIGEVIGGSSPAIAESLGRATTYVGKNYTGAGWIARKANNIWQDAKPANSGRRMVDRVDRATANVDSSIAAADEELLSGLTFAGRTGDRGLVNLEFDVNRSLNEADRFLDDSINTVNTNILNAMEEFTGSSEQTIETYQKARADMNDWLDSVVVSASKRTENALQNLSPSSNAETANRIASRELNNALDVAKTQENALYSQIPTDAIVPTKSARREMRAILRETSEAQMEDIPRIARESLLEEGGANNGIQSSIKEMRGLQSKLRGIARNASSGENANFNTARIANRIANSISTDIANTEGGEEVAELVSLAVNYSANLNTKFRQGTVGRLLQNTSQGGSRVPEGLTLERSLGATGANAREAFDDIIKVTNTPEVNVAMEDFIKNNFFSSAVRDGAINRTSANTFLRNNREVLGRFPKIQQDIELAIESLDLQDLKMARRGRLSVDKPSQSRATLFIQNGPEAAFKKVLSGRNSPVEMQNLVNMARRDGTGEAIEGLRSSFSDYIQNNVLSGDFVSGKKLEKFISDPKTKATMEKLYSKPEMDRWRIIARTAQRLDVQRAATSSSEGVLGDKPAKIASVIARLLGAKSGTAIAGRTGIGGIQAQSIMSGAYQDALAKRLNPAEELIKAAIQDEELFKEVLMAKPLPSGKLPKEATRRLNAWVATLYPDDDEE